MNTTNNDISNGFVKIPSSDRSDQTDDYKNAALRKAIEKGKFAKVEALIASGADINYVGTDGLSPLHLVINRPIETNVQKSILDLLLQKGAKVDVLIPSTSDYLAYSPLGCAVNLNNVYAVKALIQAKADLELTGSKYDTPLYIATLNDDYEMVELLLKAGAKLQNKCCPIWNRECASNSEISLPMASAIESWADHKRFYVPGRGMALSEDNYAEVTNDPKLDVLVCCWVTDGNVDESNYFKFVSERKSVV